MGERYKGCISWPPLSIHSSVGKHLVLAYMPHNPKGECFVAWYYKFKHHKGDEMWLHMILDNGVQQTKCNVIGPNGSIHFWPINGL